MGVVVGGGGAGRGRGSGGGSHAPGALKLT